jgi:hypothetical protein
MAKYDVKIDQAQGLIVGDEAVMYHHVGDININVAAPAAASTFSREHLLKSLNTANAELRAYPHEIAGIHHERAEVDEILEWALHASKKESLGMVLDQQGGGKTVILRSVLIRLEAAGIPVLSIKADTLSGIEKSSQLTERLGLPMGVVDFTRALASEGLFVVLMDQLDALSMNLSRDQATLSVMLSTLATLRTIENVRVISSCRTFDLNHDPRLSAIKPEKIFKLLPLTEGQVGQVLKQLRINPAQLLPSHRALLTTPLHLDIYARIVSENAPTRAPEGFGTLQELYEALWQRRIGTTPPAAPSPSKCAAAIYKLVDAMQNNPQLTAPLAVLDEYAAAARYLQQAGFIRRERGNYLFAHQTLFDYCYARRFVAGGRSISKVIFEGQQGLFERSQMVQVLAYLRGADEIAYRRELNALFFSSKLRAHLRMLLMDWFGSLRAPMDSERAIARRLISVVEDRAQFLLSASGNEDWFDTLNHDELPEIIREDDEKTARAIFWYLGSMMEERTSEVIALLRLHIGESATWNQRIVFCLARLNEWKSDEAIELLCEMLQLQQVNQGQDWDATLCLHNLAKSNPAGGCRAVRAFLDRRVAELLKQEQLAEEGAANGDDQSTPVFARTSRLSWNEYLFGEHSVSEVLEKAVEASPEAVVDYLLPWYVQVAQKVSIEKEEDYYPRDWVFASGWYDDHIMEGAAFALRMTEALQQLARSNAARFCVIARTLAKVELLAVHRVLVNAYLVNPEAYADDIFEYFTADRRHLAIGDTGGRNYDSVRLFGAVFSYLNAEQRGALERLILSYYPSWEGTRRRARGITQLHFLKSVSRELLSVEARRRLEELERKFPNYDFAPPKIVTVGFVRPPIEESALVKMSDDDWLGAMRKYNDDFRRTTDERPFMGGAAELASALSNEAKKSPERFYQLSHRFDDPISFKYVQAVISALAEASEAPSFWLFDVVRRFASRIKLDDRRYICWALDKQAKDSVPDDLLDLVSVWALQDSDPSEERWETSDQHSNKFHQGDPYTQGINSNRGASVQCVCRCALQQEKAQTERAFELLEQASDDPSTAVRACIIECLDWMLNRGENDRMLDIFERVMNGYARLLQVPVTHRFLHRSYGHHFPRIRPFIERMLNDNTDENTRQNGAALSCLAAFDSEGARDLEERAMTGDHLMRRGAAQVYARQLKERKLQDICREKLLLLMHDPDEDVRASVGNCFQFLRYEHFASLRGFIEEYISSPSLAVSSMQLVKYMKNIVADEHTLTLDVAERVLDSGGFRIYETNKRGISLADEGDLTILLLAVYTHTNDAAAKERAMELFERLLVSGSYAARTALQDWDRR